MTDFEHVFATDVFRTLSTTLMMLFTKIVIDF